MTRHTDSPRPGAFLLQIARLLLNADVLSTVVEPTIADLQREMTDAGNSRVKRLRARWRGYCAFWLVTLVAPFAVPGRSDAILFPDAIRRVAVTLIVLTLLRLVAPALGGSMALVAAASVVIAVLIHRWHARHPSYVPSPTAPRMWSPQINYSSTEIDANVGGLIFVVGSVFVVVVGLPSVIWFLIAGTAAGCLLAWGLIVWHTRHPHYGLPANRIVCR